MAAPKTTVVYGLLGDLEPTYGGAVTLAAADDGILLAEEALCTREWVHDGARDQSNGSAGPNKPAPPSGRSGSLPVRVEMRGLGSAYGASAFPPGLHTLLRVSGHSVTTVTTGGSESHTYKPVASSFASGKFQAYGRGELITLTKAYGVVGFDLQAGQIGVLSCDIQGVASALSDTSLPSITHNNTIPPKVESVNFDIDPNGAGSVTSLAVRSIQFESGRTIAARTDMNTTTHGGFHLSRHMPMLTCVFEDPALSTIDFFSTWENGYESDITFTVGSTQYNRYTFTANQAYVAAEPERGEDNGVALLTVRFKLASSTPVLNDNYEIVFD